MIKRSVRAQFAEARSAACSYFPLRLMPLNSSSSGSSFSAGKDAPAAVPVFAVLGVVNEGKTSIVATLSEDPHARPDPTPGATVEVEPYTVFIDGTLVMRLYDTPGFQNAIGALAWVRAQNFPPGTDALSAFVAAHARDPDFENECRLLRPVLEENACILYVVDGSSPLSPHYLAEMELLRLSGRRRLALINSSRRG